MTTVTTSQGIVRGTVENGVRAFKGIPYAAPPFGPLRFRPPAPHEPWSGELDCTRYGATVPKPPYPATVRDLLPEPSVSGEDCLNLNVWTPEGAEGLPVYVWIHGGAFQNGTGAVPVYDGTAFARDGVVTVTINYRLGIDGFGHLPDAPDNRGLLDQIAALEWVRDTIAAFGGDPARVTIGGESAGAMSVTTLTAMPAARGLFTRVIAESGAGHHVLRPATAAKVTALVAELLGVEPTAEALGAVTVEQLIDAQARATGQIATDPDRAAWDEIAGNAMPIEPVVDGRSLPGPPWEVIAAGDGAPVDLLIGSNDDEHALFLVTAGLTDLVDEPTVRFLLSALGAPDTAYDVYRETGSATAGDVLVAGLTDWFFRIPALRLAEARQALGQPTFVYQFGWPSPALDGRLGACHALEIAFAFDTLGTPENRALGGDGAAPQALADDVHAAWVAFIRDGDPGWPAYGAARTTRRFGGPGDGQALDDPAREQRELWAAR